MTVPIDVTPREAVRDVLASYCRGVDRRDRSLVAECFTENATDDHGTGPRAVEDFLDWCFDLLARYDSTFHLLGQSSFDFIDPTRCFVETYGVASHRCADGPAHLNLTTGFRYLDDFVLVDHHWRIERRVAVTDWSRGDSQADWWPVDDQLLQGRPGPDDPSYRR